MKRHVVWGALLVGGVACASPETRERPAALPTWPVDRSPIVDIAGTVPNSDWVLEYPFGGTRLSSGAIAIGDRTGAVVYFFDEKGRPLRKVGREGAGPGESRHIDWLGRCGGDSVFAWDIQLHRVTVIGPDGTIARQTSFPPATTVACSRTGTFAVVGVPRFWGPCPRWGRRARARGTDPHGWHGQRYPEGGRRRGGRRVAAPGRPASAGQKDQHRVVERASLRGDR